MNDMHVGKAANAGHVKIDKQTNYIYETDVKKDSCLKDLYITNPEADKERIEGEKGGLLKDCYSWILYSDNFLQWRDVPEQHLLWVRGDPGKGKTMLLAGLITELEKTSDDGVFYFFCQAARPSHRTASNVLRGVIWLFVSKRPGLKSYVRREYDQAGSNIFIDHNAWYALSGILTAILEDETSADCVIIIDALDECTEGREKLIGYISQCSITFKAKWVISSRNWPEIESQLDATQSQVRLHLELNHASISNAVIKFVDSKVNRLNSTYDQPSRERIRKHLLDNANDTFLWVALVCQELEKPGVKHYHSSSILNRFPAGLNELYERMISDINDRDMKWCRAILAAIAVAMRPLSLQELAVVDGSLTEWVEDKETIMSFIVSCGSLLTVRGDRVYTIHQSVNDFLRTTPKILHSGIAQQQLSIFLSSIKVMEDILHRNLYELKDNCVLIDNIPVLPSAPLTMAAYACVYWVDHFCAWPLAENQHQNSLCYHMISLFLEKKYLYWLEAMSLLRCTSGALKAMQRLEDKVSRGPSELKLLVKDAVRFAFTHRTIMDVAPLQLYDSALIFTPQLSKVKGYFDQEIDKSICVFSPDFQHWDACVQTIPGIASRYNYSAICEFSPDGRRIAMINSNDDSILFIDASTGELVKSIESPGGRQSRFTFHPSGDSLVTLYGDTEDQSKLSICYLPNGEYRKFTIHKHYWSTTPSISPDGQLLALGSDFQVIDIWDLASLTKVYSCQVTHVKYIAWIHTVSHPQALLILGSTDISIWGIDAKHQMFNLMSLTGIKAPEAVTVSRDRTCCVVAQRNDLVLYSWGSFITVQIVARFDQTKDVYDASWVDDGLIAICGDFGIELWDIEAEKLVGQVSSDFTRTICYGGNRQLASLGFQNGTLKIWSLDAILSHSQPATQRSANKVKAFTALPSGKVAAISSNGTLDMLSVASDGKFYHVPKTVPNMPSGSFYIPSTLAFGPSDCFALATNGGAIHIFNFDHRTGLYYCERRIEEHLDAKQALRKILFWGEEQIVTLDDDINFWDLKTGRYLRKLMAESQGT
ncbi:related to vegetatible incompatibility protein HET-E-1 [Fusarium fujikuroi]|nr:related to vegetatible incompatibility protein HET-E-1 [Fusarium fujikuroi]